MKQKTTDRPSLEQIKTELRRVTYGRLYRTVLKSTVYTLITVAAIAVLIATLVLPILQISGGSMAPALQNGDIVCALKTDDFDTGDIIAFYYNNKILVKRVIATAGDWVDMDKAGNVYVNGELLEEPYLEEKSFGEADIDFPYQVPESKVFVMGDHRSTSVDSRHSVIGCISTEQVVGRIFLLVWPMERLSTI